MAKRNDLIKRRSCKKELFVDFNCSEQVRKHIEKVRENKMIKEKRKLSAQKRQSTIELLYNSPPSGLPEPKKRTSLEISHALLSSNLKNRTSLLVPPLNLSNI